MKIKVFVNLEMEEATIQIIRKVKLFDNPARRFVIESDGGGFSTIEKREDGYHFINYLRDRAGKIVVDDRLTEDEAKRRIREVLREREENQ